MEFAGYLQRPQCREDVVSIAKNTDKIILNNCFRKVFECYSNIF